MFMPEKEPQVTFTDRRKISLDGEIRPEAAAQQEADLREAERRQKQSPAPQAAAPSQQSHPPAPSSVPASANQATSNATANPSGKSQPTAASVEEEAAPEGPSAQETAESHAAYKETTQQLDEILRSKTPDSGYMGPVSFDHLVQSMYMTAMMGLGAGTRPGEKPRVDLMGARQTIDLLGVLQEKTKGNLTADEQRLLESALFELRMMFLEITNAIARNAAAPKT
jgi:hypothetical protein